MPWYTGTIIGAMALTFVNYWSKSQPITFKAQLVVLVPLLLCNLGFWYGFINSDSFLKCWFTGTALTATAAFMLSLFIFDKSVSMYSIGGVCLIIIGQQLLGR
jgi:hypothetical protein